MTTRLERVIQHVRPPGRRHLRTFASLTAAGQCEAALSMLSLVLLVRLAGAERSGQIIFAQSLSSVWFLLLDPRLDDAAQRFVPLEQQRSGNGSALFARLLRWDIAIGAAASGVGLLLVLSAFLLGLVTGDQTLMFAVAIISGGAAASTGSAGAAFALTGRLHDLGLLRLRCAALSFGLSLSGLLVAGPLAYLVGQTVGALVAAVILGMASLRAVLADLGPAVTRVPLPAGLVSFTMKASAGTSAAAASESGVLTLAGFLGGPMLVTFLKISSAPSRLYTTLISPVASMLYPRLAQAAASGDRALIRRDVVRATLLLAAVGAISFAAVAPMTGTVLVLAYGIQYGQVGQTAVVFLGAACVKATISWSKVLPLALGRPGWRLAYLSAEGVLLLGLLCVAVWTAPGAVQTSLVFGWETLALTVLGTGCWLILMRRLAPREAPL